MPSPLPSPVARFEELARHHAPASVETAVIDTAAWMRRPGMPPLPLEVKLFHQLGREFVHDIRIGRGRLSLRFGLDGYVGGRGVMKVGPPTQRGVKFDQGALIALWAEVVGFPWAWEGRDDVTWQPVDDHTALLVMPGPESAIPITVGFDQATGHPTYVEAERYKGDGPKVRWRGISSEWRRFGSGVLAPGRFEAKWADEPGPWIDLRTWSVQVNVPIDDALQLGRRALRQAVVAVMSDSNPHNRTDGHLPGSARLG